MSTFFEGMSIVSVVLQFVFVVAIMLGGGAAVIAGLVFFIKKLMTWFGDEGEDKKTPADRWFESRFGGECWEDPVPRNLCRTRSCERCYHPETCRARKCERCTRGEGCEGECCAAGREARE